MKYRILTNNCLHATEVESERRLVDFQIEMTETGWLRVGKMLIQARVIDAIVEVKNEEEV